MSGPAGGQVAVAAPHPAAVQAAREVVAAGGNAIDAALAAAAALTVAYPHQCSVGGDLVAVVRPPGGAARVVLSVGAAAAATDVSALRAGGSRMPGGGPQTVTVPGVVAGWTALARLGARLGLARLLAPAVALARHGVPVSEGLHRAATGALDKVRADPGLSALLLGADGGMSEVDEGMPGRRSPLPVGATLIQPALADTLETIAADPDAFYRMLADGLRRLGSPLTLADFARHRAEVLAPLRATVHGVTWAVAPPPTQGATLLAILGTRSTELLRAAKRARLRRDALLGDPRTGPVDLDGLLLRADRDATPLPSAPKPAGDTVAVTAVGADGVAISLIQSVFQSFGSGLLEPATGAVLHNRGSAFSLDPAHPGRIQPGSRPPHTLCPTLATVDDTVVALGCQGGRSQPWILAQVAGDVLDAADPHAVLARPRWVIGERDLGRTHPSLVLEPGVADADALGATAHELGLRVAEAAGLHDDAGHVQVARLRGAALDAASDVRADGLAAVLGPPTS
jgi:gamma-glutamyltranspeptidase